MQYLKYSIEKMPRQHGAVLITSLVLLLIMTLLGLTTMSTSSTEERMASNNQEMNRAFHAADAGLASAFMDGNSLDTSGQVTEQIDNIGDYDASATYTSNLRQITALPRSGNLEQIWGAGFGKHHFELRSVGTTESSGANSTIVGGIVQIGPINQ